MAQLNSGNYDALAWVQNEVQQSLADALQTLTRFIDDPSDTANIEPCISQLHQVNGIMEMLNLQGALILSQEMLASAIAIRNADNNDSSRLQDSLLKGLMLLPNYLKQVGPNVNDHPIRLLSTINELRLSRDEKVLSEVQLFKPNLSIPLPDEVMPKPHDISTQNIAIDKLSHAFQVSLLNWIKNNDDKSLGRLQQLIHYLRTHATQEKNIILWWVAEGLIEAIQDSGLELNTTTKLSLSKLNDPIKTLSKHDELYLISVFPTSLVQQILLLIAKSTSTGPHVSLLKDSFDLTFYDDAIHQKIYSFSNDALTEARSGILEQLGDVKELLNQFDRHSDDAQNTVEQLNKEFNTLSSALDLMSESQASITLRQHQQDIEHKLNQDQLPSDLQMMALADDILRIENQLQQNQHDGSTNFTDDPLQSAVLNECLNELSHIKEKLILVERQQLIASTTLPETAQQLDLLAGSTTMLKLDDVTSVLQNTSNVMTQQLEQEDNLTELAFGQLAEIIAAIELYLEGLSQHGQHQFLLLEQAQSHLAHFGQQASEQQPEQEEAIEDMMSEPAETSVDRYIQLQALLETESQLSPKQKTSVERYIQQLPTQAEPKQATSVERYIQQLPIQAAPKQDTSVERYIQQLPIQTEPKKATSIERYIQQLPTQAKPKQTTSVEQYIQQLPTQAVPKQATSVERYIQQLPAQAAPKQATGVERYIQQLEIAPTLDIIPTLDPPIIQFADGIDPDIADVFLEEADEVLAELDNLIPIWIEQQDQSALTTIRRHFHTLKGSGRMAGALDIGDLAWSVEDLLNHLLDGTIASSHAVIEVITDSHQLIPALLTRFTQAETSIDSRAQTLRDTITALMTPEAELSEEQELAAIFAAEANTYIATFTEQVTQAAPDKIIDENLLRAVHSLKGSAKTAHSTALADLSVILDARLNTLYQQQPSLTESQQATLQRIAHALPDLLAHPESDIQPYLQEIESLTPDVEDQSSSRIAPEILSVFIPETEELWEQYQLLRQQLTLLPDDKDYQKAIRHTLKQLADIANDTGIDDLSQSYSLLSRLIQKGHLTDETCLSLVNTGERNVKQLLRNYVENQDEVVDLTSYQTTIEDYLAHFSAPAETRIEPVEQTVETPVTLDTDPELLEAFTEECAELLASSDMAIKQWQQNPEDDQASMQLQRDLHTLKGGARLLGISAIADLTHHTESLVLQACDKHTDANTDFFHLLQRCQDRLSDMQDQLSQHTNIPAANSLIADIDELTQQTTPQADDIEIAQLTATPELDNASQVEPAPVKQSPSGTEQVRVKAELLDFLTNFAGEVNISRDRVSQQNGAMRQQLSEMESTVERLQEQLRKLEMETEAQILFRYEDNANKALSDFDPLELDRFSQIQQLSRGLTESVTDLHDITRSLEGLVRESDTILIQQSRLSTDLQQGLMNTRLLPFSGLVPRFERIVRQTNDEVGKQSELIVYGADRELDRTLLDHIVAPIEHLLRNAISHGVEDVETRLQAGKDPVAQLTLTITRDGSEILMTLSDDGRGIDVEKIRQKALDKDLINPEKMPSDDELVQLILHSGFSTADDVSQLAGRGVGMDVVNSEIRTLKGRLSIQSVAGQGTSFHIRLPLTLSVMQALLIGCAEQQYAVPLASVHAGERISIKAVKALLAQGDEARYEYNGTYYKFMSLATLLNQPFKLQDEHAPQLPLLLFSSGDTQVALVVDTIYNSREIVLKSVGEQLGHIPAINGATILGDGQVVFILDIPALVNTIDQTVAADNLLNSAISTLESLRNRLPVAMVVDDSITMRKASANLLKRHGFDVITARDGIDAVAQLNEQLPDIILLDIEMPRMDGFEFATLVRNDPQLSHIPIIMITSRTGDKHRNRARSIGVNAYLGKPYQEGEIVDTLQNLLGAKYPYRE